MKKHRHIKRGTPLGPTEMRFLAVVDRLIQSLGRTPTVTELEEHWPGARSGVVEYAHLCRAKGALSWRYRGRGYRWENMKVAKEYLRDSPNSTS